MHGFEKKKTLTQNTCFVTLTHVAIELGHWKLCSPSLFTGWWWCTINWSVRPTIDSGMNKHDKYISSPPVEVARWRPRTAGAGRIYPIPR